MKILIGLLLLVAACSTPPRKPACVEAPYGRVGPKAMCYDCSGRIVAGEAVGVAGSECREPRP